MTYCTLEEAWGTNFEKKKKKKQHKKKKEEIEHFENTTNVNEEISEKTKTPQESYLYDFSRSPYTLPEHNGNNERINIQDKYIIDNSHLDEDESENENENETVTLEKIPQKNEYDSNSLIDKINELLLKYEYNQGNTTQEVVLFALIGIFIIFVLDTFVKIGKMYN